MLNFKTLDVNALG